MAVRLGREICSDTVPPRYREFNSSGFIASCQSPVPHIECKSKMVKSMTSFPYIMNLL